jgi:hypothetical protein
MQDLKISEFALLLKEELREQGVDLPKSLVFRMTRAFFAHAEKIAASGNKRFIIHNRDLNQVYPIWDVKSLCAELADGKDVLTIDKLVKTLKLDRTVDRYYKRKKMVQEVTL